MPAVSTTQLIEWWSWCVCVCVWTWQLSF